MAGVKIPGAEALEPLEAENAVIFVREGKVVGYILGGTHVFKSGEGEFIEIGQGSEPGTTDAKALFVKSPADSGASIGSSFESDSAGVGSSTAKGVAEVFAFAGSVIKKVIDKSGVSDFLQLATPAKRKIDFGESTVKWSATEFADATVAHNLGAVPKFAVPIAIQEGGSYLIDQQVKKGSLTTTNATFRFRAAGVYTGELKFFWLAIG